MTNFKSGSGNLDFGGKGSDEDADRTADSTDGAAGEDSASAVEQPDAVDPTDGAAPVESTSSEESSTAETAGATATYPYFVRRGNVGDERDTRLEIHVRQKVADREAAFRNELADRLDASEVSKTDAREFALLAAFDDPERVAELMREEGFGALG